MRAPPSGDALQIFARGANNNATAGERVKRLQNPGFQVLNLLRVFEKNGRRRSRMAEKRKRKLGLPDVPIRVGGPFHFLFVPVTKRKLYLAAIEFIGNNAVIDAFDGHQSAATFVEETIALFDDGACINDSDAE